MASGVILVLVVVTAVAFDFTNGFHDTANAVATSIATGALKPRVAVMMSAVLNLICAVAIASGTAVGGWRIINTMGNRLTDVESPQGFAAESASASVILASSFYGYPLSTTQVVSGGVMGAGLGKRLASVRWGVAGQMATAWVFTIPAAAAMGAAAWELGQVFGSTTVSGSVLTALIAAAAAAFLFQLAQRNKVTADDLDRTNVPPEAEAAAEAGSAAVPAPA